MSFATEKPGGKLEWCSVCNRRTMRGYEGKTRVKNTVCEVCRTSSTEPLKEDEDVER